MTKQEIQTFIDNALSDYIAHKADAWTTAFKLTEMVDEEKSKTESAIAFFASVIKSGEKWTDVCEAIYKQAIHE